MDNASLDSFWLFAPLHYLVVFFRIYSLYFFLLMKSTFDPFRGFFSVGLVVKLIRPSPHHLWGHAHTFLRFCYFFGTFPFYLSCGCCCFCSITKSWLTLFDPMDRSTPGFHVLHYFKEFAQTHVHWVSDAIQPSHPLLPLLILPSVFPSIRVFSNVSVICIKWPQCWSFIFSISSSNEYSGL